MGLIDYNLRLTPTAQAWTATAVTTDKFPLTQTGRDIGIGEPMCLQFTVTVAALVAGTESMEFQAQTATNANGTTGALVIASSGVYTVAAGAILRGSLAVGAKVVVVFAPGAIGPLATHLCGKIVIASGAEITCLVDMLPLSAVANYKTYTATPSVPSGA